MKKSSIEEIIYVNTEGVEISLKSIELMKEQLKQYTKNCTLHMLQYCFENVGKEVNIEKEIERYLNE